MSTDLISAEQVLQYLLNHPEFFTEHGEVLARMNVPAAHGGRAISLHERQLEVLREKNRTMELRLAELMRIGQDNDVIGERLHHLIRDLLVAGDPGQRPGVIIRAMSETFAVPQVAMRLWGLQPAWQNLEQAEAVPTQAMTLADGMTEPYCGPNADLVPATWLPGGGADTRSLALLPLRRGAQPQAFGLLVLGSADADRFRTGMGTAFLQRIAETASAALSGLVA
jgi:uncharacterized protein